MKKLALILALSASPALAQTAPTPQETQTAILALRQQREALADQAVQLVVQLDQLRRELDDLKKSSVPMTPAPADKAK